MVFLLFQPHYLQPLNLTILGGSFLFEILGAWRRLLCAKKIIPLVETIKLVFFIYVRPDDFQVSRLVVDDLHGSLPVNAEVNDLNGSRPSENLHGSRPSDDLYGSRYQSHDFIPRFWLNLAYLGRLPRKSSDR
ncbi:hypothetical protein IGI04_028318, partial [Brassica rapa subsp. trilocularis]